MANPIRVLSLCAGAAGLDLGFREVFQSRTVAYVEREGYAAANLAARIGDEALDAAPIFDDVQRFNARAFHGCVDAVIAGFPCPPVSVAGARKGIEDERWLWPDVWRVVRETGAWLVGLENVSGLVSSRDAFGSILTDLAESGWSAEWLCLRASDVGASHRRERWFCLAYSDSRRLQGFPVGGLRDGGQERGGDVDGRIGSVAYSEGQRTGESHQSERAEPRGNARVHSLGVRRQLADATGDGRGEGWTEPTREQGRPNAAESGRSVDDAERPERRAGGISRDGREQGHDGERQANSGPGGSGEALADPRRQRDERRGIAGDVRRKTGEAEGREDERQRHGRTPGGSSFAPGPNSPDWPDILKHYPGLIPAYPVEPELRRVDNGLADRLDANRINRLRLCGNGVVPQQAAAAFGELRRRLV